MDIDDEQQESDGFSPAYETTRQGLIFCIDATEKMFQGEDESGKCYLQRCLKCVRDRMMNNIMVSDKEFIGVMFMGATKVVHAPPVPVAGTSTDDQPAAPRGLLDGLQDSRNLAIMFEVTRPNADILIMLDAYINSEDFAEIFMKNYNVKLDYQLSDGIWTSQNMLLSTTIKFGAKELFLMTCDDMRDMPVDLRRQACKRADTIMRSGISTRLLYLGDNFEVEPFFKELLVAAHPNINFTDDEKFAATNIDVVPDAALTRSNFNRHVYRTDWNLAKDFAITVNFYSLFRRIQNYERRKIVRLEKRANAQIRSHYKKFDRDTGALLKNDTLFKGIAVDDRAAFFTTREQVELRDMYPVGMFLLGFKPLSQVWLYHVKQGMLVQPSDVDRPGSSQVFFALLQACLESDVVAVCRLVMRSGVNPRLVYLLPQAQGSEGMLGTACFHLIYVPYSGECREYGPMLEETQFCSDEMKAIAMRIIRKLRLAFNHSFFKNVEQQTHFCAIEALALGYDEPAPVVDTIDPDQDVMDTRIEALANVFWQVVGVDEDQEMDFEESESTTSSGRGSKASTKTESDAESKAKRGRGGKTRGGRGASSTKTESDEDSVSSRGSKRGRGAAGGRGRGRGRATAIKEEDLVLES